MVLNGSGGFFDNLGALVGYFEQLLYFYFSIMFPPAIKKQIIKLQQKKYRYEFGEFLLEGVKGIEEAIKNKAEVLTVVIDGARRGERDIQRVRELAEGQGIGISFCGRKDIGDIKTTDTFSGVLAIVGLPETEPEDLLNDSPIIALDGIKDPGNLGTIIRTADWFGVENILLSEDCVEVFNPKTVRSTMGSLFHVNIYESTNIVQDIQSLKKEQYSVITLDLHGKPLSSLPHRTKTVFIFGSESHGVSKRLAGLAEAYTISGKGEAESLNVAVSVGIVLHTVVFY